MKLIKRILSMSMFAIVLVVSMFTMTACNLISTDKTAYYNQIVATFKYDDTEMHVTMTDLNNAFKSYGYSRYNEGQYTSLEECINDSLTYHIQKELLFADIANKLNEVYSKSHDELFNVSFIDVETYDWDKTLENIYNSNVANALEIRHNAFESMQSNIDTYAEQILKEDDKLADIQDPDAKDPLRKEKAEYESKVIINDEIDDEGNRVITIEKDVEELILFNKTDISQHFEVRNNYDEVTTAKAYNKYVNLLQQTARSEGRSTDEQDVMLLEESYNIKDALTSKLLQLYQYYYETKLEVETSDVIEYYINQYDNELTLYEYNMDAYRTAMEKYNSNYVYYHNNSGNEFILVNHILINFTEEQKDKISALETKLEADKKNFAGNEEAIEALEAKFDQDVMNVITTETETKYEIDGVEYQDKIGAIIEDIVTYVAKNDLTNASIMSEKEISIQKAKNFEDMKYIYNDDPGIMNSDFFYAVDVNDGIKTNWEEEFTKGARELYSDYKIGDVLVRPVVSSYGIHIMFHAGMASNIITAEQFRAVTVENLVDTKVNLASDKTMFEYLYDKVVSDTYNNYVNGVINSLYNTAEIKIDSYKFQNLWQ